MSVVFGPGISRQPAEGVLLADTNAADRSPFVVQAVDTQTGNLMECRDPSGNVLFSIDSSGTPSGGAAVGAAVILAPAASARNVIQPTVDSATGLTIRAHSATQTANLLQVSNFDGTHPFVSVGATGRFAVDNDPSNAPGTPLFTVFDDSAGATQNQILTVTAAGGGFSIFAVNAVTTDVCLLVDGMTGTTANLLQVGTDDHLSRFFIGPAGELGHDGTKAGFFSSAPVVKQAGASAAGIAAVTDANAKAALTALQAALAAYGLVTSPA